MVIEVADREAHWPGYLPTARSAALRGSLSLPLTVDRAVVGALNLYGFAGPGMFSGDVRHRCELFSAHATGTLQLSLGRVPDQQLVDRLDQALASRTGIDQVSAS